MSDTGFAPSDDDLREIARKASTNGIYSGGVKALRAVYAAGARDVQKWLARQLREDAAEFEVFAPGRSLELVSYFLEYLTLPTAVRAIESALAGNGEEK